MWQILSPPKGDKLLHQKCDKLCRNQNVTHFVADKKWQTLSPPKCEKLCRHPTCDKRCRHQNVSNFVAAKNVTSFVATNFFRHRNVTTFVAAEMWQTLSPSKMWYILSPPKCDKLCRQQKWDKLCRQQNETNTVAPKSDKLCRPQNVTFSSSLSLVQCSLLLTFDRANWERNKRSAGRRKNYAIGEIWKYLCERSEKSNTKNHKKWEAIWSH